MSLQEFDIVRLSRPLAGHDLPVGAQGTIVMDYASTPPAFEVEFVDGSGNTTALLTVSGSDLEFVQRP